MSVRQLLNIILPYSIWEFLLFVSHGLSAFGDRMFAFALPLIFSNIYPSNMFPPALFLFTQKICIILMGSLIGWIVDTYPRFRVMMGSLVLQNIMVACCGTSLSLLHFVEQPVQTQLVSWLPFKTHWAIVFFLFSVVFGAISEVASMTSSISLMKDWIVVMTKSPKPLTSPLSELNAYLRRVDQISNITSPLIFGLILTYAGTFISCLFIIAWNIISLFPEMGILIGIYMKEPLLHNIKSDTTTTFELQELSSDSESVGEDDDNIVGDSDQDLEASGEGIDEAIDEPEASNDDEESNDVDFVIETAQKRHPKSFLYTCFCGWQLYFRSPLALVSISYVFLYFTVLHAGVLMLVYLKSRDLSDLSLTIFKACAAVFGVLATFVAPLFIRCFGIKIGGSIGLIMQFVVLLIGVLSQFFTQISPYNYIILMICVVISRLGLWVFDLAETEMMQRGVEAEHRGTVNSVERVYSQMVEVIMFFITIFMNNPDYFYILMLLSLIMLLLSNVAYHAWLFVCKPSHRVIEEHIEK